MHSLDTGKKIGAGLIAAALAGLLALLFFGLFGSSKEAFASPTMTTYSFKFAKKSYPKSGLVYQIGSETWVKWHPVPGRANLWRSYATKTLPCVEITAFQANAIADLVPGPRVTLKGQAYPIARFKLSQLYLGTIDLSKMSSLALDQDVENSYSKHGKWFADGQQLRSGPVKLVFHADLNLADDLVIASARQDSLIDRIKVGNATFALNKRMREAGEDCCKVCAQARAFSLDQVRQVFYIHDWMDRYIYYDFPLFQNPSLVRQESLYETMVEHRGVCDDYADTFEVFMCALQIPEQKIVNTRINHSWNLVELRNTWYQIDVTWDDAIFGWDGNSQDTPGYDSGQNAYGVWTPQYTDFLMSDATSIAVGHDYTATERAAYPELCPTDFAQAYPEYFQNASTQAEDMTDLAYFDTANPGATFFRSWIRALGL